MDHRDELYGGNPKLRAALEERGTGYGLAYYRCYATRPVPLTTLVRVAGSRWRVEETLQSGDGRRATGDGRGARGEGKGLTGLEERQVCRYTSWTRCVSPPCSPMPSSRFQRSIPVSVRSSH
ncbi:hypothetical protein GCM10010317_086220 [Streptomyces mirabilis]|nr:hypothetical protein GCM10010317_086220 [Streptomyces mirabilis]